MRSKRTAVIIGIFAFAFGFVLLAGLPTASSEEGEKATYKGSNACKACHAEQYKAWQEMKHSKAIESLKPDQIASGKDEQGRACVQCHVTGYENGGFTSMEATPKLANVGCESCHGAGSKHVATMLKAMMEEVEVEEKHISRSVGCTQCHTPHINYKKLYGGD
jgi:hypothetical protein